MARSKLILDNNHFDFLNHKVLIFDGMNIAYAAYYANRNLSYKGVSTSMIFGVPNTIRSYIDDHKPQKVFVVWDGDKHPKRLETWPKYKSHREANREPEERKKFMRQIRRVQKALYYLGIPQVRNENVEGDDMIYKVVKNQPRDSFINIISGDKDFEQLLCKNIQIINPRTRSPLHYSIYHISNPVKDHTQALDALIMLGDSSDDIPGYKGIGPVKCRQFFEKFPSIKTFLDNPKANFPGIEKDVLKEVYKRNRLMMDLAYFDKKYNQEHGIEYLRGKRFPQFNPEKWRSFCIKYNLKTFQTHQFLKTFTQ